MLAKSVAIFLGTLLFITNGFWIYSAIDLTVTEKYRQQEEYESNNRIKVLKKLCSQLVGGMEKEKAIKLLNEISPEFEAYEKEGHLNTIWLSFKINEQGNVVESDGCN